MRCPNCNHEVKEGMLFCQQCGTKIEAVRTPVEGGTFGWAVLGFLLFPVGLILFFIWRREYPKRAKSSGKGAFLGLVLLLLLYIGNIAMQYFIYQSFFNY